MWAGFVTLVLVAGLTAHQHPEGTIVSGVIVRDSETVKDIRETASTILEKGKTYRLVVTKSRYRLDVLEGGHLLKAYPVALGLSPTGAKERSGDMMTPEGKYTIIPHYQSAGFGECFYICYPSESDGDRGLRVGLIDSVEHNSILEACRAARRPPAGTRLGGLILLHGTNDRSSAQLTTSNWTWGCIAMENSDLHQLLNVYGKSDRPVLEILP